MIVLTSSPGAIPSVGLSKTYYSAPKRSEAFQSRVGRSYDSATFSYALAEGNAFQMNLVSHLSQEVRTATTTGDIQALRQSVASGEYTPDPIAIAGKILFLAEA